MGRTNKRIWDQLMRENETNQSKKIGTTNIRKWDQPIKENVAN